MDEKKILLVSFHCDGCGEDTHIAGTSIEKEREGKYHCIHCGNKGKSFYNFDDYYVRRLR